MGPIFHCFIILLLCGLTEQQDVSFGFDDIEKQLDHFFPQFDLDGLQKSLSDAISSEQLVDISQLDNILNSKLNLSTSCVEAVSELIAPAVKYIKNRDIDHLIQWLIGSKLLSYIDSWGKLPSRILLGNAAWYGGYDECQSIPSSHYCLSDMILLNQPLLAGYYGTCVPKRCSSNDISQLLHATKYYLQNFADFPLNGTMAMTYGSPVICNDKIGLPIDSIICISLCIFLAVLCLLGTLIEAVQDITAEPLVPLAVNISDELAYDNPEGNENFEYKRISSSKFRMTMANKCANFFTCFSLLKNMKSLFSTDVPKGSIRSLNGIRTISIVWVVLGHLYITMIDYKSDNGKLALHIIELFSFQAIANAYVSVDTFFLLSGVLVAYLGLKKMDKKQGKLNILMFYVHRFIRLTPSYMFILFVYNSLLPFTMDSPLGMLEKLRKDDQCARYWWTNLLYINNFYPIDVANQCMSWCWYLANDMQFYIISPLFLYIMYKYKLHGALFSVLTGIAICITVTGALTGYYDAPALFTNIVDPNAQKKVYFTIEWIYYKPYCRISPYLIGLLLGYFLSRKISIGTQLIKTKVIFGWMLAFVFGMLVVYGPFTAYEDGGEPFSLVENVLYASFSRVAWGIAVAWVIFACHNEKGGIINTVLSWKLWIPLSRLTYGVYLWHPLVVFYLYTSNQNPLHYQRDIMVFNFISVTVLSFGMAMLTTLGIDYPVANLENKLFRQ